MADRDTLYAEGLDVPRDEDGEVLNSATVDDERFLDRIMADLAWGQSFYSRRNQLMEEHVQWFFGQHYDTSPIENGPDVAPSQDSQVADEHLVTLNIPYSSITRAHTMITNEEPAIEVLGTRKGNSKVEQFLYGSYYINTQRWGTHPFYDAIFNQLLKGWGVIRTTWNPRDFNDVDESFKGDRPDYQFPIEIVSLDPQEVYPIPGGTRERWKAIVHHARRFVYEVEDEWDVILHQNDEERATSVEEGRDPNEPLPANDLVDFIDYWAWKGDSIIHACVANQQYVKRPTIMKFYDSLPFEIFFCTATTDTKRGEHFGLPANYALVSSVAEMEWLVNRHMRIVDIYADPVTIVEKVNDSPVREMIQSGVVELVQGERAYYLQFNGTLPDISMLEQFFRNQIDEEGFALPRQGESGLDTIALQQAGLIKIFKPVENAEQAWESVNSKIIGLLQRWSWTKSIGVSGRREGEDGTVDTFSINIKGSETKGSRYTRVRLRAKFPLEELRNAAMAQMLVHAEMYPRELAMKRFLHIQDTKSALDMIDEDKIRRNPIIPQTLIDLRMKEIMMASDVMRMVQEEMAADQGTSPEARGEMNSGTPENPMALDGGFMGQPVEQQEQVMAEGQAQMSMPLPDNAAPMGMPLG
jgi:hypothetical protein